MTPVLYQGSSMEITSITLPLMSVVNHCPAYFSSNMAVCISALAGIHMEVQYSLQTDYQHQDPEHPTVLSVVCFLFHPQKALAEHLQHTQTHTHKEDSVLSALNNSQSPRLVPVEAACLFL